MTTHAQEKAGASAAVVGGPARRLVSLDVLRGLTVAGMILVNNAGNGDASYAQLRHSRWNGCTLTDLVFPMFLFIMGVSMALSFEGRLRKQVARREIALQVLRRSLLIAGIGLVLNALPFFQLASLRYCGVLQRIGVCYLLAGIAVLVLRVRGVAVLTVALLAGYWWLMTHLSVPGYGRPGVDVVVLDPQGNLAGSVDRFIIPVAHRYHGSFYDPEGLLSTLPALATTCIGVLTAAWLRRRKPSVRIKLVVLIGVAVALVAVGLLWAQSFPFNKRLWTSSYVLLTAGISIGSLALLSWWLDDRPKLGRAWKPALAFGTNALAAYVLSEMVAVAIGAVPLARYGTLQHWLFLLLPAWLGPSGVRSLLYSVLYVAVCFVPVAWLYRRRVFIKL